MIHPTIIIRILTFQLAMSEDEVDMRTVIMEQQCLYQPRIRNLTLTPVLQVTRWLWTLHPCQARSNYWVKGRNWKLLRLASDESDLTETCGQKWFIGHVDMLEQLNNDCTSFYKWYSFSYELINLGRNLHVDREISKMQTLIMNGCHYHVHICI